MTCGPYAPAPADCARCPALVQSRRRVVPSWGEAPARVLLVGEAPGYWGADRTGVPFHGDKSGKRLQKMLIQSGLSAGFDPVDGTPQLIGCAVTNTVRCFPAKAGAPMRGRPPSKAEIAACDPYLDLDLAYWQPQILVPIGAHALLACTRRVAPEEARPIMQLHALPLRLAHRHPSWMLPMRHPSRGSDLEYETWIVAMRALLESLKYEH